MSAKLYRYVGPEAIRASSAASTGGISIASREDLRAWLDGQDVSGSVGTIAATFVIDPEGRLRLADRRSEHVACAAGKPILSAGEIVFSSGRVIHVEEVSNLSTGYCPEPGSWEAVGRALDGIGVENPGRFTTEIVFRRCPECGERNVVKDGWFVCQVCGGDLPEFWNFEVGLTAMENLNGGFHAELATWTSKLPTVDGKLYVLAYEHGTLSVELYAPRGVDAQTPHRRDEVYVVVRGEGWFVNGPARHRFGPGDLLFVRVGVEHRFEEFTDDLAVWVVFYGPEGGEPAGRTS